MLIALVNGAFKEKDQLFAVADEEGLMDALPAGSSTSKRDLVELQCVLYEALLGSRRVRGTSSIVTLVKGRKGEIGIGIGLKRPATRSVWIEAMS